MEAGEPAEVHWGEKVARTGSERRRRVSSQSCFAFLGEGNDQAPNKLRSRQFPLFLCHEQAKQILRGRLVLK